MTPLCQAGDPPSCQGILTPGFAGDLPPRRVDFKPPISQGSVLHWILGVLTPRHPWSIDGWAGDGRDRPPAPPHSTTGWPVDQMPRAEGSPLGRWEPRRTDRQGAKVPRQLVPMVASRPRLQGARRGLIPRHMVNTVPICRVAFATALTCCQAAKSPCLSVQLDIMVPWRMALAAIKSPGVNWSPICIDDLIHVGPWRLLF